MKYEVHMTVSVGVIVNAPDAEIAEEKAVQKVEKKLNDKNMFIAGGCYVDTTEPTTITLKDKRREAEEALKRLFGSDTE